MTSSIGMPVFTGHYDEKKHSSVPNGTAAILYEYDEELGLPISQPKSRSLCCQRVNNFFINSSKCIYTNSTRIVRNLFRVTLAGGLSMLGGVLASDPALVVTGSLLGGVGNGLSTWLAWETDVDSRVDRLEKVMSRVGKLEKNFSRLEELEKEVVRLSRFEKQASFLIGDARSSMVRLHLDSSKLV